MAAPLLCACLKSYKSLNPILHTNCVFTGGFHAADAQPVENASVDDGNGPMAPRPPRPPPEAVSPPPPGPPLALSYPTIDAAIDAMVTRFHLGTIQEIMAMGEFDFLKVNSLFGSWSSSPRNLFPMHQHQIRHHHTVA